LRPPLPTTLHALHDAFRVRSWRPSEIVEAWLARAPAERAAPVWISTASASTLRERAHSLDRKLDDDPERALQSPVFGALVGVKDNIDVRGLETTAACPRYAYLPEASAPVVAALERGGAIVVGKTNLDQFATGLVGTRSPHGAVPNAFDPRFISGGSSSGSAVAVARGLVHVALGTDTAGSGRVPAGFNNIVGWKPTRGVLSAHGMVPACRSLDCMSIFALTVGDAARVFSVASQARPPGARRALDRPRLRDGFTFALPRRDQLEYFGDTRAAWAFEAAIERLERLGGTPLEIDFAPWRSVAAMLYEGPHVAERLAGLRTFFDAHAEAIEPTVRGIVAGGRRFTAADAFVAQANVAATAEALAPTWRRADVMVVPTAPTIYRIAEVDAEPLELNRRLGTYTNFVNLLDLAAIAVPSSMRDDGLPSGITLIGPAGSDWMLASLAQRYHHAAGLSLGALSTALPPADALPGGEVAQVAVVGAHLTGLPLNHELTERGATLARRARTAPAYRLYALPATTPPKPGLVRHEGTQAHAIDVEVWELSHTALGAFLAGVPRPLAIGNVELDDGSWVKGFLCESSAIAGAEDISRYGGWRRYLDARSPAQAASAPHA